jgi:hypothetical protein
MSVGNAPKSRRRRTAVAQKAKIVEALEFSRAKQVLGLSGDEGVVLEVDPEEENGGLLTGINGQRAA